MLVDSETDEEQAALEESWYYATLNNYLDALEMYGYPKVTLDMGELVNARNRRLQGT